MADKVRSKYIIDLSNSLAYEVFQDFIYLFFPRPCLACSDALVKGEETICTRCLMEMPKSYYHLDRQNPFYQKLRGRISVERVMALFKFVKQTRIQHLMHALKYKNHPEIGVALGRIYGSELKEAGIQNEIDMIIPVPLHRSKKRSRGFNQSERFGYGLSEVLGIPCLDEVLIRTIKTETQTRKTRLNRWQNVKEVFQLGNPEQVRGKRILMVDDVITTGATLEACGSVLLESGCASISIACIAAAQ